MTAGDSHRQQNMQQNYRAVRVGKVYCATGNMGGKVYNMIMDIRIS